MQSSLQMVHNGCNDPASPPPAHVDAVDGDCKQAVISVEAAAAAVEALVETDQQALEQEHTEEAQQQRGSARAMPAKAPKKHSRRRNGVHPLVPHQGAELQEDLLAVETEVVSDIPVEQPVDGDKQEEEVTDEQQNDSVVQAALEPVKLEDNQKDVKLEDDQKCRSCWATFPSVNELGIHIKKQHVVNRVCHRCGITKFDTYIDFEEHHLAHVNSVEVTVKLEILDESELPPVPPPRRAVARKRTARAITPPPVREPIKLTLRLTTGRQAKAAEERHEAERRAEMLTAIEAAANNAVPKKPEPSTKEEALFHKAITELNSPVPCDSPAPSFVLRYSPSPPASTASTDQQSNSQPSSRPPSVGGLISVRPPEALQAPAGSADADSLLRNMLDKISSPQQNAQEPEFVSLDRLANSVNMTSATTVPLSNSDSPFLNTTAPSYQPMHLQNLAAMQPNPILLPNLLMTNSLPNRPADPLSMSPHLSPQMPSSINFSSPNNLVPSSASSPQGMSYSCGVCGSRWPNLTALEAHCGLARHYRCAVCNHNFSDLTSLNVHRQAAHGPSTNIPYLQPHQPRNPPPLYRGTVMTTQQQYQPGPPPLVYQQAPIRAPSFIRQFGPRPDQFRAAAPMRQAYPANMRQIAPHQQQQPRNIAPQPRHPSPVLQNTPTKRPAPLLNSASPPAKKRPEIPARQPEDCQIIAMQQSGDGVPQIQSVQGSATVIPGSDKANASIVKLTSEITLSVKPKPDQQKKNNVASLLANRGITVTTSNKNKTTEATKNHTPPPAPLPVIPESLSMNSSISILPASRNLSSNGQSLSQQPQTSPNNFAVPRARPIPVNTMAAANPERPPRPPTVDLTSEAAIQAASRAATSPTAGRRALNCSVCQRPAPSSLALQQHMQVHHPQHVQAAQQQQQQQAAQNKLPYRCTLCPASYPTVQGLHTHRQAVHKEPAPAPPPPSPGDMGVPVVDLRAPGTVERLSRLGIHHYIPLPAQNGSHYFSIPIVSADLARNNPGSLFSLQAMNATSVMPFGPLRALPR